MDHRELMDKLGLDIDQVMDILRALLTEEKTDRLLDIMVEKAKATLPGKVTWALGFIRWGLDWLLPDVLLNSIAQLSREQAHPAGGGSGAGGPGVERAKVT